MYAQFFGFTKLPFRLRPDPEFLFSGRSFVQTRAAAVEALRSASRLVSVVGPPGVGKTMLLEDVLGELASQFAPCRINQPHISATELVQAVLFQLGTPSTADSEINESGLLKDLSAALDAAAIRDSVPLLVIDDAQLLTDRTLVAVGDILIRVRRLKLLLVAREDPEHRSEALATRLAATAKPRRLSLPALSAEETKAYVKHRLEIAGTGGKEIFTADAFAMIFQHSNGSARLINLLCDAALHAACLRASGHVGASEILVATQDARWSEALGRHQVVGVVPAVPDEAQVEQGTTVLDPSLAPDPPNRADRPRLAAVDTDTPRGARLVVNHRKQHIATWPVSNGKISIGRASDNELCIDAPYISRHHCQVLTVGNISTVEDLGSVNGLSVNGKPVKRHILQHDDKIAIGMHVLTFVVSE